MSYTFDDARLDDPDRLAAIDPRLRYLAESGARVRREIGAAEDVIAGLPDEVSPRAMVAAGEDARLLRAVLEPWCPVPLVAWPGPGLPGWAGSLDLVVVLDPSGDGAGTLSAVREATRRGCLLVVACPAVCALTEYAGGRDSIVLATQTGDTLAVAVGMLEALHAIALGPEVNPEGVAQALDEVAARCSPYREIGDNQAKDLALAFAEDMPVIWGGSVLAARAARRVAEAFRRTSGRPALAGEAGRLLPVLEAASPRDVFADPFEDSRNPHVRPGLLVLDDGAEEPTIHAQRQQVIDAAAAGDVRTQTVESTEGPEMARYATLLTVGTYAATYLGLGLGRP